MRRLFTLLLLLGGLRTFSQDPHFSQFFSSPLTLNPAYAGIFDGKMRLCSNFRQQWPSFNNAFSTSTFSVDGPIGGLTSSGGRFAGGLLLATDQSGNGILKQNNVSIAIDYTKYLDRLERHSITVGFQGGLNNLRFDRTKAYFEDQLTPSGFTLPTEELTNLGSPTSNNLELHSGVLYMGSTSNNNLFYLGTSMYHINSPHLGFLSGTYYIRPRMNIHGGGYVAIDEFTTLHGSFQFQHHYNYKEFVIGSALSRLIIDRKKSYVELYVGAWARNKDSFFPYLGIEYNEWKLGMTYDVNTSNKLGSAAYYQTGEASLIWRIQDLSDRKRFKCPKF